MGTTLGVRVGRAEGRGHDMTETHPDSLPDDSRPDPDPDLAGAGLSATGRTADDFDPGDEAPGTTYGSPTGAGGEQREPVEQDGS
jgi:hypothetical protein